MPTLIDPEFGKITIRRNHRARQIKLRLLPDGRLGVSLPPRIPLLFIKRFINSSRQEVRDILDRSKPTYQLIDGQKIGKSHTLIIQSKSKELSVVNHGKQIIISLPDNLSIDDKTVESLARQAIIKAIKNEARSYLPKRLDYLANKFGYSYTKARCSHSGGRWGSCNSDGVISLNIALMKLPFELIDYVIIHELAHTREMNHSPKFWELVYKNDPNYQKHRKLLRLHNPSI